MLAEFVCRCEVIQHDVVGGRMLILCNAWRYCERYPYNFLESMKQRICPKRSLKSYAVLDVAKCRVHEKKYLTDRLTHVFESYVSMKAHSLERVTSQDLVPYSQGLIHKLCHTRSLKNALWVVNHHSGFQNG